MPLPAALFPSLEQLPEPTAAATAAVVLLVEDEECLAHLLTHLLKRLKVQVIRAPDGTSGLELFEANRGRISLALIDCHLPDMDGRILCKELRLRQPRLPLLLTSGRDQRAAASSFAATGPAGFLPKPYMPADVLSSVSKLLAASRQG